MKPKRLLTILFFTMMKIGLFTFGGGYAMLALLENEFVTRKQWLDREEFLNLAAIAESTPGPNANNPATYIGYKKRGFFGALTATLGISAPSFAVIYAISLFFDRFLSLTYVAYAFHGIRVCVVYLILSAGIKMLRGMKKAPFHIAVLVLTVGCMVTLSLLAVKFSTVFYILIAGVCGIFLHLYQRARSNKEERP